MPATHLEVNSSLMECAMIRLWIFVRVISKANNNHIKIRDDNYDDLDDDDDYLKGVLGFCFLDSIYGNVFTINLTIIRTPWFSSDFVGFFQKRGFK